MADLPNKFFLLQSDTTNGSRDMDEEQSYQTGKFTVFFMNIQNLMLKLTNVNDDTSQIFEACFDDFKWNTQYFICTIGRIIFSDIKYTF